MKKQTKKLNNFIHYATSILPKESVERANIKAQKMIFKLKLAELRKRFGIKQSDIEGFSQVSISRIEGRSDIKISTLIEYMHACGMELEIKAIPKKKKKDVFLLLKV